MLSKKYIDKLANTAATSPLNDTPEPSEDQKKSGVYKKGHISTTKQHEYYCCQVINPRNEKK